MGTTSIVAPSLSDGEIYIDLLSDKKGGVYHLVLLPGDSAPESHENQLKWAKSIGGDLPDRIEAITLFSRAKGLFKPFWYWTKNSFSDPDIPEYPASAWAQSFHGGSQRYTEKRYWLRARAVCRILISERSDGQCQ